MAYEIVFIKNKGRTVAVPRETNYNGLQLFINNEKELNPYLDKGYGYIKIANSAITDAENDEWKLLSCVSNSNKKVENKIYMTNPKCHKSYNVNKSINPHSCSLYCIDNISSKYKAYQLIDSNIEVFNILGMVRSHLKNGVGRKREDGRHYCMSSYSKVTTETPLLLNIRRIMGRGLEECDMSVFKERISGLDVHHKKAHWDMRGESVGIMMNEQHREYHTKCGRKNHRMDVVINTVEELNAFLDFVESDLYNKLFK